MLPSVVRPVAHTKPHAYWGIDGGALRAAAIRRANCIGSLPACLRRSAFAVWAAATASRSARAAVTGTGAGAAAFEDAPGDAEAAATPGTIDPGVPPPCAGGPAVGNDGAGPNGIPDVGPLLMLRFEFTGG